MSSKKSKPCCASQWIDLDHAVLGVAMYISDAPTMFAYLEALRAKTAHGPLEGLWQLGLLRQDKSSLWPILAIEETLKPAEKPHLETCIKLFRRVKLVRIVDVPWLHQHLDPSTSIAWIGCPYLPQVEFVTWAMDWCSLRITELTLCCDVREAPAKCLANFFLHHLHDLESLQFTFPDQETVATILHVAANSKSLTSLSCFGYERASMSVYMQANVLKWFATHPVKALDIRNWFWQDAAAKQEFYKTAVTCPTLESLAIKQCNLTDVDFSNLTLTMKSLEISFGSALSAQSASSLATALRKSKVERLKIECEELVEPFLEVLSNCSVTDLTVRTFNADWAGKIIPLLAASHLQVLEVEGFSIGAAVVEALSGMMRTNKTLRTVDMRGDGYDSELKDLRALMDLKSHSDCTTMKIDVGCIRLGKGPLEGLMALAKERGVELKYSEEKDSAGEESDDEDTNDEDQGSSDDDDDEGIDEDAADES